MTIANPSIQQQSIFEAITDRAIKAILVIATAGAGKTSTLVHAMNLVQGRIAFAAFNRKIVKACQDKTKRPLTFINNSETGVFDLEIEYIEFDTQPLMRESALVRKLERAAQKAISEALSLLNSDGFLHAHAVRVEVQQ